MKKIISMFVFCGIVFITGCISIMKRSESDSKITQLYNTYAEEDAEVRGANRCL